ncbi:deoxyribodipyrimidine photo-lyase [Microvirga roseola]|uniref:deoxyribodipyrimidine photo-lyase n=1 Tax=Microvirga roseola TaxID=2883126 RepID=UPI001E5E159A|nr:deoxyribodipyrimidine photo-lyase [Microvirga roseola]
MACPVLVWFRDDHRLYDNPALSAAVATGSQVLCLFVVDEASPGLRALGGAARWWLHGSLQSLQNSLEKAGSSLILLRGPASEVVERTVCETNASAIFWNRRYGAAEITIDSSLKKRLTERGTKVQSFNGRLLHEPWEIRNQAGGSFQVFTPYLRAVMGRRIPPPLPAPRRIPGGIWPASILSSAVALQDLDLEPSHPDWAGEFKTGWRRGEEAAQEKLDFFLENGLSTTLALSSVSRG